jgi:NAD(P)-dependent dehydrogenase (short-subunit alcohol dehydrogenase family)
VDVRDLRNRTVLVTGAASGIGRASAIALGARGADLALCDVDEAGMARTAESLATLGRGVFARRVDVSNAEEMGAFAEAVHKEVGAVDVLVNNAGVGLGAGFLDTTLEDWDWILGINLRGVVLGCHFFVPHMVERGQGGHVVNVASMAAYVPSELLCAYSTTKCAVLGFSEALRLELAPRGIGVTAVCPGVINTPITRTSRLRGRGAEPGVREEMVALYERRNYTAERVARAILRAVQRNRGVAPISPEAWASYYLKRLSPAALYALMGRLERRNRQPVARAR